MVQRVSQLVTGIFFLALFSGEVWAQNPVRINWTAVTGAQSGIFMAAQEKLFKKNGLDVTDTGGVVRSRLHHLPVQGERSFRYGFGIMADWFFYFHELEHVLSL